MFFGSSGKPKGAIISQHNIKYLIDWSKHEYNFNNNTIHTALNPIFLTILFLIFMQP